VLRAQGLLSVTVSLGAAATAWLALLGLRRDGRLQPVVPWLPLVATACGFVLVARHWGLPEERVHLIQYGLLGVLLGRALPGRLALALLCGWVAGAADEGIQYLLPGRTFDSWDILANALAVSASLLLSLGGRASWCAPALLLGAAVVLPRVHTAHPAAAAVAAPRTSLSVGELDSPEPLPAFSGASVLLITVDALRRDVVPPWGQVEVALPAFERLARESVTAEEGFANAIWTSPGIQSLLTGLLPEVHGVQARGDELPMRPQFPLEQLEAVSYRRVGYAGDATENYRNLGFDRELDRDEDLTKLRPSPSCPPMVRASCGYTYEIFTRPTMRARNVWLNSDCTLTCPTPRFSTEPAQSPQSPAGTLRVGTTGCVPRFAPSMLRNSSTPTAASEVCWIDWMKKVCSRAVS